MVLIRAIFFSMFAMFCLVAQAATTTDTPAELYFPTVNTIAGNPNGKITLVEFFDYRCEYCRKIPSILTTLLANNPDLRVVYRDYPLLGPQSAVAAESALSAQQQGKYLQMHQALFASNKPIDINIIRELANQYGIDTQKMEKDNLSYLTQQQLRENARFANQLNVDGIPTFFVALTPMSTQHTAVEAYQLTSPSLAELQDVIDLLKQPN